ASLVGTGKASGLKGDKPDIQGLQIVAKDFDPVRFTQVYPPLEAQLAGMIAGPIGMKLTGAGSAENAAFDLLIDLTPVKLDVPKQLTKAVGAKMLLEAKARLGKPGAPISFTSSMDLAGVDLRPGLSLTKAPGDTMKLSMAGTYRDLARPEKGQRIDLSEFRFDVLADTITGKLWAELASAPKKATRFELTMRSDKLDLDKLLQKTKKEKVEKPPPDPKTFAGLSGKSDIRFAKMISSGMEMKNVVSVVQMTDDLVDVQKAELDVLDGHVSAAGTSLKLAHPKEPMTAKLDLKGIDLAKAAALATDKKVLTGKLDSLVDVKAAGQDTEAIKQSLAGTMNGKVIDGVFYGKDLVAGATGPLAKSLPFGLAGKDGAGGQTSLGKEVQFSIVFANGEAKLAKPITITQPDAGLVLTGGMKLDGALNLPGTLTLAPGFIAQMTGGKAKVSQPVPVKLRIAGQVTSPKVTDLDFGDAVATIGKGALGSVL
ncbi:MAG: YdbH domain-containing protein, partial [Deltaproteobacteria bacterium]|nr:YdbH domain-containing protein [Deltaproteobacteria bacterium]